MLGYIISDKIKINLKNYEIKSFDILHKTDLNILIVKNNKVMYVSNIICWASTYGHDQILEWFKNSGHEFKYDNFEINEASYFGHVQILEWFKNSGYELKYDETAINSASKNGHVKVLEWFKNSGYEFKYDERAIISACNCGNDEVLKWFKNSGYKFKYSKFAFATKFIKIFKFLSYNIHIKKVIKFSNTNLKKFIKTLKFKTHHKYFKGYNKN
jgi:hypothetical protein